MKMDERGEGGKKRKRVHAKITFEERYVSVCLIGAKNWVNEVWFEIGEKERKRKKRGRRRGTGEIHI